MIRSLAATVGIGLLFTACAGQAPPFSEPAEEIPPMEADPIVLPDLGIAPELENEVWLNTDAPLTLAGLRGKVVLLDMWTFG